MKTDLRNLVMDNLIVHEVPKKFSKTYKRENPDHGHEGLILSDAPTTFDSELTKFLQLRFSATIGSSNAFEIELDPTLDNSEAQIAIRKYFDLGNTSSFPIHTTEIISITQNIAKALHHVQTAKNPGGILLCIPCHCRSKHGLAILKVERQEGVRMRQNVTDQGKITFDAQHIKDLMLTSSTKLFKIVLFYQNDGKIIGYVCDQQQRRFGRKGVADFFLVDFLGCKLSEAPRISTKKFFDATTDYINSDSLSSPEKWEVSPHLISELTNNYQTIQISSFADRAIPAGKKQGYMDAMNDREVPTFFDKDIELVKDKIKKAKIELASGIKITGTQEAVKNKIEVEHIDDGEAKLTITDRIRKVE